MSGGNALGGIWLGMKPGNQNSMKGNPLNNGDINTTATTRTANVIVCTAVT